MTPAEALLSDHLREAHRIALDQTRHNKTPWGVWRSWLNGRLDWRHLLPANISAPLGGYRTRTLRSAPPDPWPGDATRGAAILSHEFPFFGHIVVGDEAIWRPDVASRAWREQLHAFEWLSDLHIIGSDAARLRARSLITAWIGRHRRRSGLAWRSDIIGRRIFAWLGRHEFFCASADDGFKERVYASLGRQLHHLLGRAGRDVVGARRLAALKGVIHGGLCLPESDEAVARGLTLLENEITAQILPDGGHTERSPHRHLTALRHLIDIRAALRASGHSVPASLQGAIDRMAPMVRFFRHGDGRLAGFNGGGGAKWLIDMVLNRAEARGKAPDSAPHSGFQRLRANRSLILLDTGPPTLCPGGDGACAGTLSFEMSIGREAMIVNCGNGTPDSPAWQRALRTTPAHSTLTLDGIDSSPLKEDGLPAGPIAIVHCLRNEENGNIWVDASHDGYQNQYGVRHMRRLYLARQGDDLRGEDLLIFSGYDPRNQRGTRNFAIRFHLHPDVQASPVHDRQTILIRLPSGQCWRFYADVGLSDLEESVFIETDGTLRRSEQIALTGCLGRTGVCVRWALKRVPN